MTDPRLEKLARVLVHYSLSLQPGEIFRVLTSPAALPLVREVYREALVAGAHTMFRFSVEELDEIMYKHASDEQLTYVSELARQEIELVDASLSILASENTRHLSGVDASRVAMRRGASREISQRFMQRSAAGETKWCVTLYPTNAAAQDADMSLADYTDFVTSACKLQYDDPVAAWKELRAEQQRIVDHLNTRSRIRIVGPDTDLSYVVAGRSWVNCFGDKNFPDGEVFTGPVEDQTEGYIRYSFPAIYSGREVSDVRLWFERGKVVKATAERGEDLLHALLDMDEGARRLGEVAFGTNYDIKRFSRNILFDEKIGGTAHLALGAAYPETGAQNESALHWDMVCDLREHSEVYADDELIYKDGKFIV